MIEYDSFLLQICPWPIDSIDESLRLLNEYNDSLNDYDDYLEDEFAEFLFDHRKKEIGLVEITKIFINEHKATQQIKQEQ